MERIHWLYNKRNVVRYNAKTFRSNIYAVLWPKTNDLFHKKPTKGNWA